MEILEVKNIRKEYGTLVAVNDVCMTVEKGQVVGLIGPNGAGKTTLLRILATVLPPTDGNVRLLGYDLKKDYLDIRQRIGYMPDFFNLYENLTLQECLEFFAEAYSVPSEIIPQRVSEVLEFIGLQDKRLDFVRHISRGMVQRLGIGVMLVHNPDVLLLDEPASGLDPAARIQLRKILKRLSNEGKTIIISSHILTELSGFCTHIAIMNRGSLEMFGAVEEIQKKISGARKVVISVFDKTEEAVAIIKEKFEAEVISVEDKVITIELVAGVEEMANLNTCLIDSGIKVFGFTEEKTSIEDLFMKISSAAGQPNTGGGNV